MEWDEADFNPYNQAGLSEYSITDNGKVYIVPEKTGKIGLTEYGMYKLVKDWISESSLHAIPEEQKKELIALLRE